MRVKINLANGRAVILKHASREDVDGIWRNFNEVVEEAIYLPIFEKVHDIEKEAWYEDVKLGRELCIVAQIPNVEPPNNIAGQCEITDPEWDAAAHHVGILGIIVREDFRGLGLGEILIDCAIRESKKLKNKTKIILSCFSTNKIALSLYKKLGFEKIGIRKKQFYMNEQFYDEVLMELFIDEYLKEHQHPNF